tara:strand:- start:3878 stop:6541 length:2664 start_codon:yes stop_codon:yes gene_type:complete
MNGYAGTILKIDLTDMTLAVMPTSDYSEDWVGGHGMGSAIFFDLVEDKRIDGFDPANVLTMMTSPFCGTTVPAAGGRTEVQGIGVQSYPYGWFTRSNFGGRFSSMLKYAGWDGIVLQGKADRPVWIDIRNDDVQIRDCADLSLWGMKTQECQETIWNDVANGNPYGDWISPDRLNGDRTTHRPAVVCIGPAGENQSRLGCLMHDRGNAAGQGGFGGIWGAKNLKAISVVGTGSVHVHDPAALIQARLHQKENYELRLDDLKIDHLTMDHQSAPRQDTWNAGRPTEDQRPQACVGCHSGCRARYRSGVSNEVTCYNAHVYYAGSSLEIQRRASDLINEYGVNAHELMYGIFYLAELSENGVLDSLDCPLDFSTYGSLEFFDQIVKMVSYRNDGRGNPSQFGEDVAGGFVRAAEKWGRLNTSNGDLKTGLMQFPYWGIPVHRDPRAQLEWGYGSILGDRDANEHDFDQWMHWYPTGRADGTSPFTTTEAAVKIHTDKMVPYAGDMQMLDYSTENMYSAHIAKLVAWHRHYTRFWKQSTLLCDWRWPDFMNAYDPHLIGSTGEAEPTFLNAVTGRDFTFLDGIEMGRKIWNLDQSIWTLQGRHRDDVHFADYVYSSNYANTNHFLPGKIDGQWTYFNAVNRNVDRSKFEEFKTLFYQLEGWSTATGYPTRSTLESLGLKAVADELEENDKYDGQPVITRVGAASIEITQGDAYVDAGATALDAEDGDITANIVVVNSVNTATIGVYTIAYNVVDADGKAAAEVTRSVAVVAAQATPQQPPVITRVGAASIEITQDDAYVDAGATALDAEDGDITANIVVVSSVNTAAIGVYTITYNVVDADGNAAAEVTRSVAVVAAQATPQPPPVVTPSTSSGSSGSSGGCFISSLTGD